MSGWGGSIPEVLVALVAERVKNAADFVRCAAVCRLWQCAFVKDNYTLPFNFDAPHVPWMMLAESKDSDVRGFFNLETEEVQELVLPEARGRHCCGCTQGWLVTVGLDMQIHLLNPLSRARIGLPSIHRFTDRHSDDPEWCRNVFLHKVVLSSSPRKPDCIAMAIHNDICKLAFARPGDEAWSNVVCPVWTFRDILYFEGNFYAITVRGEIVVCDIRSNPQATIFAHLPEPPSGRVWDFYTLYLLELSGDMLVVAKHFETVYQGDRRMYRTREFLVLKLVLGEPNPEWVVVKDLGDYALFLGFNSSISVSTMENRCRGNCIYFNDDLPDQYDATDIGGDDRGIFDLGTGKIEPHYKGVSRSSYSPPIWITPNPLEL